ncbi:SURP and G-patch domain-containing protein 1 isoform X2 [Octopus bimaculoides]|uniref:SURP and G-patch domain-containing protein 1 isoform X2 n=1 Tax=Octopus bimaculoides TaxID=37653 RepID=UPI00071C2AC4|nr:SURP and G-patch domain-containing protein 1 isoform X2 [Octopus bimaculoides]|eukprot:XP_014789252.1 PREDICTED: SURP and G-patch domain-containing protein 1-like isoform X2 [Octopus bimaculoides]
MSRLGGNNLSPATSCGNSAPGSGNTSNYYGTSLREKMKQMSRQEQIIEEKKRKIQQKLEDEMKNLSSETRSDSSGSAPGINPANKLKSKLFGKRPSLLKKYTDLKKPKVEIDGLPTVSPLNPVVTTASQDMFVNDGSFLERFKKLQGLVPSQQSDSVSKTGPQEEKPQSVTQVPCSSSIQSQCSVTKSATSTIASHPTPLLPTPSTLSAVKIPNSSVTPVIGLSSSSNSHSSTTIPSPPSGSSCKSYKLSNSNALTLSTSSISSVEDEDDKYDPTSPTEDLSPVKLQPTSGRKENLSHNTDDSEHSSVAAETEKQKNFEITSNVPSQNDSKQTPNNRIKSEDAVLKNLKKEENEERVIVVSPADDPQGLVDQLAVIIAQCGPEMEKKILAENKENPSYWFLYDTECSLHKKMWLKIEELRSLKNTEDTQMTSTVNTGDNEGKCGRRKRRSRWGPHEEFCPLPSDLLDPSSIPAGSRTNAVPCPVAVQPLPMTSTAATASRPPVVTIQDFARKMVGSDSLSDDQLKQIKEQRELNMMYELILAQKKAKEAAVMAEAAGIALNPIYEYDSDEDVEGGTWEHKKRMAEMNATREWAEQLTEMNKGKHFIGDFLPPDELEKFMETYNALKEGREPDLSDYKEFKLTCENIGYQMLQRLGWQEGEGLGSESQGIKTPVNKGIQSVDGGGFGVERPANLTKDDDEYEAFRKRMMLAYRFRPNPLNNPRRPYY